MYCFSKYRFPIALKMADLKKDLDEYLLLQSDQKKSFKIQMPTLQKPAIGNWFKREPVQENNSWFQETKKDCCPSLVILSFKNEEYYTAQFHFSQGFSGLWVVVCAYVWEYFAFPCRQCIFPSCYSKLGSLRCCLH